MAILSEAERFCFDRIASRLLQNDKAFLEEIFARPSRADIINAVAQAVGVWGREINLMRRLDKDRRVTTNDVEAFIRTLADKEMDSLEPVRKIIDDYHVALDRRHHGGVAAGQAVNALEHLLGMPWEQGKALEAKEASALAKRQTDQE